MAKYVCTVCGFVYDEAEGHPDSGIAPGTKWEDVPEDFTCPLWGGVMFLFVAYYGFLFSGYAPSGVETPPGAALPKNRRPCRSARLGV